MSPVTEAGPPADIRSRIARRLSPCACGRAGCGHPVVDALAWKLADAVIAEVYGWLLREADAAESDCVTRARPCGDCGPCHVAEITAAIAVVLHGTTAGLPPAGHPESTTAALEEPAEQLLQALDVSTWRRGT